MQKNNKNKKIKCVLYFHRMQLYLQQKLFSLTISFLNSQTSAHARMSKKRQVESSDPVPKAWNQMREREREEERERERKKEKGRMSE